MNVPVLIGHLYQNTLNGRIIIPVEDYATFVIAKCIATGEQLQITPFYISERYIRLGASSCK